MRKLFAGAALALVVSGVSGTAFAGEITGGKNPKPTPAGTRAASECAFSGLEDGWTLLGFNPDGSPILMEVATGPGRVQTPHMENSAGVIHPAGVAGQACRGNAGRG